MRCRAERESLKPLLYLTVQYLHRVSRQTLMHSQMGALTFHCFVNLSLRLLTPTPDLCPTGPPTSHGRVLLELLEQSSSTALRSNAGRSCASLHLVCTLHSAAKHHRTAAAALKLIVGKPRGKSMDDGGQRRGAANNPAPPRAAGKQRGWGSERVG